MAIGPVQLIVLGFSQPEFHGEIIAELERLRESDTVRVIDALAVHKDADGEIEVAAPQQPLQGRGDRAREQDRALIGLGIEGEEGMEAGAGGRRGGADGISVFSDEEAWDVLEDIPNDSAAALLLLAAPLGGAAARRHRPAAASVSGRLHQPARPRRDRPRSRAEEAEGAPRHRDQAPDHRA